MRVNGTIVQLEEILRLRVEIAELLGFNTYAERSRY